MLDPQQIFDRLERGEIDLEGALACFEDTSASGARPPPARTTRSSLATRGEGGKILLRDVDAPAPATGSATAASRIRLAHVSSGPLAPSDATRQSFPRAGRPVVELTMDPLGIAFVQMRDRDAANMFTSDLLAGLREAFKAIEDNPFAKVVVVAGTDPWFCCGGTPDDLARMRDGRASFFDIQGFRLLLDCSLPTIASMGGHALGGGLTFGLYADVALLADSAYYSANFMEHGLTPGVGTTYLLPKKLGPVLGAEMMFSARRYQGRELLSRGIPIEVLPKDAVADRALSLAREMAVSDVRQLKLLKRRLSEETRRDLPRVLREEDRMHAQCFPRSGRAEGQPASIGAPRSYETVLVERGDTLWTITLNRPATGNSIDLQLLDDLHAAFDEAEGDARARTLVVRGQPPIFCTGLDFAPCAGDAVATITSRLMDLMKRMTTTSKIVIALVDGQVQAGGVGLVAASDFVFATPRSTFALSEALWGLLPAMVLPFMVRRTGFGAAYAMTLSTETVDAKAACAMRLVDEVIEPGGDGSLIDAVKKRARRFELLDEATIAAIKVYFRDLWIVDDTTERAAVGTINGLLSDPKIQAAMKDYAETGRVPWERGRQ